MHNVLVTGATGFIGSHLVKTLLKENKSVRVLCHYNSRSDVGNLKYFVPDVNNNLEIMWGDLRDSDSVKKAIKGVDTVFHLGALIAIPYSYINPSEYIYTNIVGTTNVLNACMEYNVERLVHTSTSEVYGTAICKPIDENHPNQAQSPYAASKLSADKVALSYFMSFNLPVTVIRPFNCFGPGQSARAIIPTIITQAIRSNKILLGNIDVTRDWTYVEDTVNGFIRISKADSVLGEIINVGTGREVSIKDVIKIIGKLLDKELIVVCDEKRIRPSKSEDPSGSA